MSEYRPRWMNEELVMLQDTARRFFEAEFVPHEARWAKEMLMDRDAWNMAGRAGLLCASVPEEYGGSGGDARHDLVIFGQQARSLIGSFSNTVHSGIVAHYLLAYGSEVQKKKWLPKMASGELVGAIAMSEPDAGSDLKAIRTRAIRREDGYVINGSKTFITNGFHADLVFLVCKVGDGNSARDLSIIALETKNLAGYRRGRVLEKLGNKGSDTGELFFDDVRVPATNLLGSDEGLGFTQLMQQLPLERLYIANNACWQMERALEMTTAYVQDRRVFGQRLADLQNTRFRLAECKTEATLARVFVDECITDAVDGKLSSERAAMAKWWSTQKCCEIVNQCLQLHGGNGFIMDYPIARMYANVRVGPIYGGSNEIMKEIIARTFL
jgi:acyl-CoA dehydrogenase